MEKDQEEFQSNKWNLQEEREDKELYSTGLTIWDLYMKRKEERETLNVKKRRWLYPHTQLNKRTKIYIPEK